MWGGAQPTAGVYNAAAGQGKIETCDQTMLLGSADFILTTFSLS